MTTIIAVSIVALFFGLLLLDAERHRAMWTKLTEVDQW